MKKLFVTTALLIVSAIIMSFSGCGCSKEEEMVTTTAPVTETTTTEITTTTEVTTTTSEATKAAKPAKKKKTTQAATSAVQQETLPQVDKLGEISVDYGSSQLYSREEMKEAAIQVVQTFYMMEGCELHSLKYKGDNESIADRKKFCKANKCDEKDIQCIVFSSSFHSPKNGAGEWNPDTEYYWDWHAAKEKNTEWQVWNYGY